MLDKWLGIWRGQIHTEIGANSVSHQQLREWHKFERDTFKVKLRKSLKSLHSSADQASSFRPIVGGLTGFWATFTSRQGCSLKTRHSYSLENPTEMWQRALKIRKCSPFWTFVIENPLCFCTSFCEVTFNESIFCLIFYSSQQKLVKNYLGKEFFCK